jgi:hypothetical protein
MGGGHLGVFHDGINCCGIHRRIANQRNNSHLLYTWEMAARLWHPLANWIVVRSRVIVHITRLPLSLPFAIQARH